MLPQKKDIKMHIDIMFHSKSATCSLADVSRDSLYCKPILTLYHGGKISAFHPLGVF